MSVTQYWKFDDNAASTTVVATTGTNATSTNNTNTMDCVGPGNGVNTALKFNGSTDAIDFTASGVSFAPGSPWSFSAWFKSEVTTRHVLCGDYDGSTNDIIEKYDDTTIRMVSSGGTPVSFTVPSLGFTWHHLLVTKTAGNDMRVFIDGVESPGGDLTFGGTMAPKDFQASEGVKYPGRLASVRFYDSDESADVSTIYAEAGAVITDDFNRADGLIGSGWKDLAPVWNVAGNVATVNSRETGVRAIITRREENFDDNIQYAEATVVIGGASYAGDAGPAVRCTISGNGYYLSKFPDGNTYLFVRPYGIARNGSRDVVAADSSDTGTGFEDGDPVRLRIEANGTNIKGFVGLPAGPLVQRFDVTNSVITPDQNGKPALYGNSTSYESFSQTLDNFSCSAPIADEVIPEEEFIEDDFVRADGPMGQTAAGWRWYPLGGQWKIIDDEVTKTTPDAYYQLCRANVDLTSADHYAEVVVVNGDASQGPAIRISSTDAQEGIYFWHYSGTVYMTKTVSGTASHIGSASHTFAAGELYRLEGEGTTIRAYINGVLKITVTESDLASNVRAGVYQYTAEGTTGRLASFAAADLAYTPGGGALPLKRMGGVAFAGYQPGTGIKRF